MLKWLIWKDRDKILKRWKQTNRGKSSHRLNSGTQSAQIQQETFNEDERSKIQNSSSFSISLGKLESDDVVGEGKIRLTDFGSLMKKVFVYKFKQKLNPVFWNFGRADLEDFKTYLGHYKAGLEETANFLSYYNSKEVSLCYCRMFRIFCIIIYLQELNLSQTKEVIDLENQFSTFSNYYGAADEEFFCKDCNKKHKFCQWLNASGY